MPPPAEGLASRLILGPALRTQPDRRLVSLVRAGYETAFDEIVRRYGRPLARYAATIVGGRSEDVTQDAFSKALLALRRDESEIELRPWLFRIVRNTALNDLRDSPPPPDALAEAIAGGRGPQEELESREELADLIKRLQALPEPQRAAIVMRELEGLGHEEIAAALGLSGGAARQAIYRARQALRGGLGMLVPLPLLKALLTGAGTVEVATGAAGVGGAAGAGAALKATAATVLIAGAVGAGVALEHNQRPVHSGATTPAVPSGDDRAAPDPLASSAPSAQSGDATGVHRGGPGSDHSRYGRETGGGGRNGTEHPDEPGGTSGSSGGADSRHSGSAGGDNHGGSFRQKPAERSGHDGGGKGDGSGSGGDGSGSGGEHSGPSGGSGSDGEAESGGSGSGDSGGSGSGDGSGSGSTGGGGSGSGEAGSGGSAPASSGPDQSGSGGSGSGDSGDSHTASGLIEQAAPEP